MINTAILELRKDLHLHPELSGQERLTAQRIKKFIDQHHPAEVIENVGGYGLMAIYRYSKRGPTVVIRCELDALPIEEANNFEFRSKTAGVSHKCGHDGHMSIVAGLLFWIREQSFKSGRIVLLFQPAEETGTGAERVMNDKRFKNLQPDFIFALHNIPGEVQHSVLIMESGFSAEVQSFALRLSGKESHASEPENGINPALCIADIIRELDALNVADPHNQEFAILTPIHIIMGEKAYGVSAGRGELHFTIRTWDGLVMSKLKDSIEEIIMDLCSTHQVNFKVDWFEYFPASENNIDCNVHVEEAASDCGLKVIRRPYPFKFGEDFGWFSKKYKTAMFGLGAGLHTPSLHNADYDFPDEIIETGISIFSRLIDKCLQKTIHQ